MQSVTSAFTAEDESLAREVAASLLVSWHKETNLARRTFTIGVSAIGGADIIGANPGSIGGPGIYNYFDESNYLLSAGYERGLGMPLGGFNKAMAEAVLDNTSHRFTPDFMGGHSELFTAILPRRPTLLSAGFNVNGTDILLPQFAGIFDRQPMVNRTGGTINLHMADYNDFLQNRFLDHETMFTGQRSDSVMTDMFNSMGLATSQYDLDYGLNPIPFGYFERGTKYINIFKQLAEAENGQFYQDETGVFKFANRQHWDTPPLNQAQRILATAQVLDATAPSADNIVNVVEITSNVRNKQSEQTIFRLNSFDAIAVEGNDTKEVFVDFEDPVLSITAPSGSNENSYYRANTASDRTGTDVTDNIVLDHIDLFAKAAKFIFRNNNTQPAYLTDLVVTGRPAKVERKLYYRASADASVTAYEERVLAINNDFIQDEVWAASLANQILNDFSQPENILTLRIRALPELQLGDNISWQGRTWRIMHIRGQLDPSNGFTQELTLVKRQLATYFRVGISTIGGQDGIAP